MRIICLRPETVVPTAPIPRTHAPRGRYETYRGCLRWDFGFTCGLCLLHEAHFIPETGQGGGAEGTGLMTAEHHVLKSRETGARDRYANCIWACRWCNIARKVAPTVGPEGGALLDPSRRPWADHFVLRTDDSAREISLEPRSGDRDAGYTWRAYDLDDPRKSAARYHRLARVGRILRQVEALARDLSRLDALVQRDPSPDVAREAAARAAEVRETLRELLRELDHRWRAVPGDAPTQCQCDARRELSPMFLHGRVLVEYRGDLGEIRVSRT